MEYFKSATSELSEKELENATVEIKIPGRPVVKYRAPVVVSSIEGETVNGNLVGAGTREVLLVIGSMISTYRAITTSKAELVALGNALCATLEDITRDIWSDSGAVVQ